MCVEVEFLSFNVLLHSKSEQKVIGKWFRAPIILKNLLKTGVSLRNFCQACLDCDRIFLIKKTDF